MYGIFTSNDNSSGLLRTRGPCHRRNYRHKSIKNVYPHSSALQNRCLHTTNIERGKTLLQHRNNCIVIHKSTKMLSHTAAHQRIDVCTWPSLRGEKYTFTAATSYFLYAWCVNIAHSVFLITTQKQYWWDANPETFPNPPTTAIGLHHTVFCSKHTRGRPKWRHTLTGEGVTRFVTNCDKGKGESVVLWCHRSLFDMHATRSHTRKERCGGQYVYIPFTIVFCCKQCGNFYRYC